MKKLLLSFATVMLVLLASVASAITLDRPVDVFQTTADHRLTIAEVLDEGSEFEQLDSLTAQPGTAFDSYYFTSAPIEWLKIAYTSHDGQKSEGWIVGNPEVITGIDLSAFEDTATAQGKQGFVLCNALTLREAPDAMSSSVTTIPYGSVCEVLAEQEPWLSVRFTDAQRHRFQGWVRSAYVLVDYTLFVTDAETPVYSLPATDSKRVGLLDAGEAHPVLGELNDFLIISLRGACGFVEKK